MKTEIGCGKNLGAYMEIPEEFQNSSDKIINQHAYSVEVICGKNRYCEICKAIAKAKIQVYIEMLRAVDYIDTSHTQDRYREEIKQKIECFESVLIEDSEVKHGN